MPTRMSRRWIATASEKAMKTMGQTMTNMFAFAVSWFASTACYLGLCCAIGDHVCIDFVLDGTEIETWTSWKNLTNVSCDAPSFHLPSAMLTERFQIHLHQARARAACPAPCPKNEGFLIFGGLR